MTHFLFCQTCNISHNYTCWIIPSSAPSPSPSPPHCCTPLVRLPSFHSHRFNFIFRSLINRTDVNPRFAPTRGGLALTLWPFPEFFNSLSLPLSLAIIRTFITSVSLPILFSFCAPQVPGRWPSVFQRAVIQRQPSPRQLAAQHEVCFYHSPLLLPSCTRR